MRDQWIGSPADGVTSRLRMRGYDYRSAGSYFVTMCTNGRQSVFGEVAEDQFIPSFLGVMILEEWENLANTYDSLLLDSCQLMPDHFHAILTILPSANQPSLSAIVGRFKSITARRYRQLCDSHQCLDIGRTCWQDKFHDTIIRDDSHYEQVARYMDLNPHRWAEEHRVS